MLLYEYEYSVQLHLLIVLEQLRRSASRVLDAKPFALRFRIVPHPEGCPDNGPKVSDLYLSWGLSPPLDTIRYP